MSTDVLLKRLAKEAIRQAAIAIITPALILSGRMSTENKVFNSIEPVPGGNVTRITPGKIKSRMGIICKKPENSDAFRAEEIFLTLKTFWTTN